MEAHQPVWRERKIDVEIRSLNSKQQDINLRMPFSYNKAEPGIRAAIGRSA